MDFLFNSLWGWLGVGGLAIVGLGIAAWFIPSFRLLALEIAGGILAATAIYAKGQRDRANLETKRKEEAVAKARDDYDKIDSRPDTPDTIAERLRKHDF